LTALAAEGFRRFLAAMETREAAADPDPKSQLVAAGLGYIDFAGQRPALFRLMFSSGRPDFSTPELAAESSAAYAHLTELVAAVTGARDLADVASAWAMAHGLADLTAAGRLRAMAPLDPAERERVFANAMARALPPRR